MSEIPSWKKQGWKLITNVEPIDESKVVRNLEAIYGAENVKLIEPALDVTGHRIKGMRGVYVFVMGELKRRVDVARQPTQSSNQTADEIMKAIETAKTEFEAATSLQDYLILVKRYFGAREKEE